MFAAQDGSCAEGDEAAMAAAADEAEADHACLCALLAWESSQKMRTEGATAAMQQLCEQRQSDIGGTWSG